MLGCNTRNCVRVVMYCYASGLSAELAIIHNIITLSLNQGLKMSVTARNEAASRNMENTQHRCLKSECHC